MPIGYIDALSRCAQADIAGQRKRSLLRHKGRHVDPLLLGPYRHDVYDLIAASTTLLARNNECSWSIKSETSAPMEVDALKVRV
jgi:hypothetical protein